MVILKALISLAIASAGIYVLAHVKTLATRLQNLYVGRAQKVQDKKGLGSYLFINNPEIWKTPFATFLSKAGIIFLGIWLLLVAYPIVFGLITL